MPDEKPQPGAVPQFMAPQQVTAPLPTHQASPWGYPIPPPEPKKDGHGWDAAKLIGVVLTIGTIIFGAGKLVAKLENIEASQKVADDQQANRTRVHDDRYDKLKSSVDGMANKVDDLTEQVRRARTWRGGRRRETMDNRP